MDIDVGEKDIDIINLLNLGQVTKIGNMGMTTVTFEGYALEAGTSEAGGANVNATGFWDAFANTIRSDTSEPQGTAVTATATRFRVSILWTNDGAATAASGAVTSGAGYKGKRFVIADCYCVSCKPSMTDGVLKTTLAFKGAAFDKAAAALIKMDSGHDTSPITALASYVAGTTRW